MTEKIDKTLKKFAAGIPTGNNPEDNSSPGIPNLEYHHSNLPGDPNCPYCKGLGYVRQELPIDHPDFGRLQPCDCRQSQISQQIRLRLFALSNLERLRHLTFENFQTRGRVGLSPSQAASLERAYNQAQQYARSLNGWLLLQGGYGCGKTHLAAAIANFSVDLGVPTLFITVPDLLDSLRFAYNDPESSFEERFNEIRTCPLLILDDFGTQNATAWAQEKLFQILNYRYINQLPLVVTTNLLLEQIEGRIRSRLEDPELVTRAYITATDFRRPTIDTSTSTLSSLSTHRDKSFSRFEERLGDSLSAEDLQSLAKALKASTEFARNPNGWLVLTGPHGCGKTHLAAAIARDREDMGEQVIFISVPDLLDHLRSTFNPNSTVSLDRLFEEIRRVPLLILDDLGAQSKTPWAQEKLFQIIDYRYNLRLNTVITTSRLREDMDPRILSRLEDRRLCTICSITAPGYRGTLPGKRGASVRKPRK